MKNHYRKVANIAVACVGTAVGFILGVTEAVKAATFTLAPVTTFKVIDLNLNGQGDIVRPGNFDVVTKGTVVETAAVAEFNLGNFSLNQNTTINSAVIQVMLHSVWVGDPDIAIGSNPGSLGNPGRLGIFGYVGNGAADASDFEAGVFLSSVDISSFSSFPPLSSLNTFIRFDVTPFVKQRASNGDSFAGFGIRALNLGAASIYGPSPPRLIVETTPVPEPTTIFGSITAISVAGLLKRKKFKPAK